MQVMKWSVIALAVAAGTTQMAVASSQSESKGFVEDTSFDIFARTLYFNRDYRNGGGNIADATKSSGFKNGYREETGFGLRLLLESGFTQGTVGVGVDAYSLSSVKLDSGKGRYGTGQFSQTDDGSGDDTQTEVGGAIKFRVSDTVLKYGNQFVASPVFSTDDSRILPETATGTYLVSNEIEGLELSAGRFTGLSSQTETGHDSAELTSANIIGASYQFTDNFSAAYHASDVEDYWKKHYINANYTIPMSEEQSLNFDFNAYKTDDQGKELGGKVDNTVFSLASAYSFGAHTVTLAYQQSSGDSAYAYGVDGGGTVWLANATTSEFWTEDERSLQARYDIDMTAYGVPGLSFMARYISGWNATVRDDAGVITGTDGKEHELGLSAKYVIQEGAAKDLSFRIAHNITRGDNVASAGASSTSDVNEVRIFIDYPLSVL
ncbi:MAG: OprD family porin [Pseudomonas sp.]|uniref:OprD family porin n=1 Tax=Pseudomonas sp. TaxID=306 RepID=UPI003982507C